MPIDSVLQLTGTAALPALFSLLFFLLLKKTSFAKVPPRIRELSIGAVFGLIAVAANEFGVPYEYGGLSAIINVRDAAPICAGLFFGAPCGIIAGIIGGAERALSVLWGAGSYSVIACSVSTALAGVVSALARKKMFDDRMPSALFASLTAVVMEIVHMTVLLLTHLEDAEGAMRVIKLCAVPMIVANACAALAAALLIRFFRHERNAEKKREPFILETIESWLLIAIAVAFLITNSLVFVLQNNTALTNVTTLLKINVDDTVNDIVATTDENLIATAKNIAVTLEQGDSVSLDDLSLEYGVTEINIVGSDGIITDSTDAAYVGYDMKSGAQSNEFMILTRGVAEYAQPFGNVSFDESDDALSRKYVGVVMHGGGFLQIGQDYTFYSAELSADIKTAGRNRHIGETGSLFVCLYNGKIVSGSAENLTPDDIAAVMKDAEGKETGSAERIRLSAGEYYYLFSRLEGYFIVGILPYAEAMNTRDTMLYLNSFMEVLVFAALFVLIFQLISHKVVRKIRDVNDKLSVIIGGNLKEEVHVGGSQEMVSLSTDINRTVATLNHYIDLTAKKIDDELQYAKKIQLSALPGVFPAFPDQTAFDIFASMDTAKDVGGDFYDFYMLDDTHLAFLVADVSGKGIPAAMFMMTAKTQIRGLAETGKPVEEVLRCANDKLCEGNEAGMFVTAWMGVLDLGTGELRFANAGHNPPLLGHKDGTFSYLRTRPGLVLAGMEGVPYRAETIRLLPGDRLFLYTDGVTEATSAAVELYGEDRLRGFLNEHHALTPEETIRGVRRSIDDFVGEAEQFDDITMLMIHYKGDGMQTETRVYPADVGQMENANAFLEDILSANDANMKAQMQIMVAFEEMFVNVCHYAYPENAKGNVSVTVSVGNGQAEITLIDSGVPFNPLGRKDPDITLSAEDRQVGGLGIFMVRKTMDEVLYRYENEQNILTMKKKI